MAVVYAHKRIDNNKVFYIGVGVNNRRPYSKYYRNRYWHSTVNKYGYTVDILDSEISYDNALELESFLISEIGLPNLTNMTDGGGGIKGFVHSDKTKKLISDKAKGRISKSRKKVYQYSIKGKYIMSFESITEASKNTGVSVSSISNSVNRKMVANGFIFVSDVSDIENIVSEKNKLTIFRYNLNGDYVKGYLNTKEASIDTNTTVSQINRSCRNKCVANGFMWSRVFYESIPSTDSKFKKMSLLVINNHNNATYKGIGLREASRLTGIGRSKLNDMIKKNYEYKNYKIILW